MRIRSCFFLKMLESNVPIRVSCIKMKKSVYFTAFKCILNTHTWIKISPSDRFIQSEVKQVKYISLNMFR